MDVIVSEMQKAKEAAENAKKAKETSGKKPLFLWLKPGHKALIRPLYKMQNTITLSRHSKWNKDRDLNINSICASEIEKSCLYCEMAKDDKMLKSKAIIYLPVFVYQIVDEKGNFVTYEETIENEKGDKIKATKEVRNTIRLLELSAFGVIGDVLQYFWKFPLDPDNCQINECDFSIEQVGEGQAKKFVIMHKNPKPMSDRLKAVASSVTEEEMFKRIIDFCPPKVAEDNSDPFGDVSAKKTDPAIAAVVTAVENGQVEDDTIETW